MAPKAPAPGSLRVWLQLMKAAKAIEALVGARFRREFDQSLARFDVLAQLDRVGDGWTTVGRLAEHVMAASGNITGLLDRMIAEGLVRRRPSPTDRRSFQVRMTSKGRRLFARMAGAHAAWIDEALSAMDESEKTELVTLLTRARRAVDDHAAERG